MKKLWFKALRPDAEKLLCAEDLPPECQKGAHSDGHGVLPLSPAGLESLYESLRRFPDPRASNPSFRQASILSVVIMAQMCGRTTISDIVRFGKSLTQADRAESMCSKSNRINPPCTKRPNGSPNLPPLFSGNRVRSWTYRRAGTPHLRGRSTREPNPMSPNVQSSGVQTKKPWAWFSGSART